MATAIQVRGDQYVVDYLSSLPAELVRMIERKFNARAADVSSYIKTNLLSGQLLGVKTGRLRSSIYARTYVSGKKVTLSVSSRGDVPYAALYEYGGKIPPHLIAAKNTALLAFVGRKDGAWVYRRQVNWPGTTVRPRRYLQTGVEQKFRDFMSDVGAAIYDAGVR